MGSFSSKFLKTHPTDKTDKSKIETIQIADPRSPSGDIARTPITFEKDNKSSTETNVMKKRLLKNLKLDPRSPTDGITRTPIIFEATPTEQSCPTYSIESPISIYSSNVGDLNSLSDIMTPSEPSVNVSGFDDHCETDLFPLNRKYKQEKTDVDDDDDNDGGDGVDDRVARVKGEDEKLSQDFTRTPLRVSSKPSTIEARRILNEILTSKEFVDQDSTLGVRTQSLKFQKNFSIHWEGNIEYKGNERKRDKLKHRTPLSNITHSTNSPNYGNSMKKPYMRCKILSDVAGAENTPSPKVRQIAEWDKDKTVII